MLPLAKINCAHYCPKSVISKELTNYPLFLLNKKHKTNRICNKTSQNTNKSITPCCQISCYKGEVITFVLSAVFVLLFLSISPTIPLKNTDDGVRGRCEEMCGFLLRSNKETLIFVKSFSDSVGSTEIAIFES